MGIIPRDPVYGDDCLTCYAAGKTPKHLICFFSGINIGNDWQEGFPLPPNGYWDLVQDAGFPCLWNEKPGDPIHITYDLRFNSSEIDCTIHGGKFVFFELLFAECKKHFTNAASSPAHRDYYGGTCMITTSANLAKYIESFTPMIDPDPRMECFPMDDELIVVRYAGKRDATNIHIKFDTNP